MSKHQTAIENARAEGWSVTDTGGGFQSFEQEFGNLRCWINDGEGSLPTVTRGGCFGVVLHIFKKDQAEAEPMVSIHCPDLVEAMETAANIIL